MDKVRKRLMKIGGFINESSERQEQYVRYVHYHLARGLTFDQSVVLAAKDIDMLEASHG